MLISLHRDDKGTFYPENTKEKLPTFNGLGKGQGFNVNIAWETGTVVNEYDRSGNIPAELGAHEYKHAFEELVLPLAHEFKPDVILVSCGFDSGIGDPIGLSKLCPMMYFWMTHMLSQVCDKIIVVQEGGYNCDFLKYHAEGVLKALLLQNSQSDPNLQEAFGEPTPADLAAGITSIAGIDSNLAQPWAKENVEETKCHHRAYWKCLQH